MSNPASSSSIESLRLRWQQAMQSLPLIAILRGVKPDEVVEVATVLLDCGFRLIEVPLNSPDPFASVANLRAAMPEDVVVGAGTVLTPEQVQACKEAQCEIIIAPNFNPAVGKDAISQNMLYCPGVATPSEAFAAIETGADALKLFPAEIITPAAVKAMRAVLPPETILLPVGGVSKANIADYLQAGASGFGTGSSVYKPGISLSALKAGAQELVEVVRSGSSGIV